LILLAIGFGSTLGIVGGLYHLINHAVFKPLLFLGSGQVEIAAGSRDLRAMNGLRRKVPITSATTLIGSLSLAGIPPFNGFWSKLIIILACVEAGYFGFAAIAVLISIVTLAYQLKVQRMAFFAELPTTISGAVRSMGAEPRLMSLAMILLAVACIALSLVVLGGFRDPWLIGAAQQTLSAGRF
jgi:multicomponent Na+:H+ antiporter subunit D